MRANEVQHGGSHYRNTPVQLWDFLAANEVPFLDGSAMKYIFRHSKKGGREDLLKARHYIDKMLEFYYPEDEVEVEPDVVYAKEDNTPTLPARDGLCPNNSAGTHYYTYVYKRDLAGKFQPFLKCTYCHQEMQREN